MKKFNFIPYFFSLLLVTDLYVFAIDSKEQRKLKNKIHNFSSKNIDTDMSTKWSLTGLYLEKYDDNYTFIKNPKLKMFDSNLITNISSETAIDPTNGIESASTLEKMGFSSLYEDPKNKGHKFLFLTMAGKKTFGCIWPNARKISGRAAERFAPENLRESGRLPELLNSVNISLEVMS